jgi:lysophospholipase L1-like esterase
MATDELEAESRCSQGGWRPVTELAPRKKIAFTIVMTSISVAGVAGVWLLYRQLLPETLSGKRLNRAAWEACFEERGLAVPPGGPRDGYWGKRVPPWTRDPALGWHETEVHLPGLVEQDSSGVQRIDTPGARRHVLILGGSVAWGAYASQIGTTYFARLARRLEDSGRPVSITVLAAGGWTTDNELKALRARGLALKPDVVLFVDGMNDLAQARAGTEDQLVEAYLSRLREARDLTLEHGAAAVFSLQPALALKRRKSALEERILELMRRQSSFVPTAYPRLRQGLGALALRNGAFFVDCSDAFSGETATTFTDIWHFADPGHELLAGCLERGIRLALDEGPISASSASDSASLAQAPS